MISRRGIPASGTSIRDQVAVGGIPFLPGSRGTAWLSSKSQELILRRAEKLSVANQEITIIVKPEKRCQRDIIFTGMSDREVERYNDINRQHRTTGPDGPVPCPSRSPSFDL